MKKTLCAFLLLLAITSCKKEETPDSDVHYDAAQAYDLSNIAYGDDAKQKMDVYLPANRDSISTKVFVLIHGGGWSAGDKADYTSTMASFKTYYPDHAIININYRLGTVASPGYPKQVKAYNVRIPLRQQVALMQIEKRMLMNAAPFLNANVLQWLQLAEGQLLAEVGEAPLRLAADGQTAAKANRNKPGAKKFSKEREKKRARK